MKTSDQKRIAKLEARIEVLESEVQRLRNERPQIIINNPAPSVPFPKIEPYRAEPFRIEPYWAQPSIICSSSQSQTLRS